ncbi:zinc finger protein 780A-like [Amia ocellicauda]|uniref:zinc finger protein 780A-like n=1 Tax=Amia ocellicauda TaxID=2972642 RepID=UPI0034643B68
MTDMPVNMEAGSKIELIRKIEHLGPTEVKIKTELSEITLLPIKEEMRESCTTGVEEPLISNEGRADIKMAATQGVFAARPRIGMPESGPGQGFSDQAGSGEKRCHCSECRRTYKSQMYPRRHQLVHEGLKTFKCPGCGECFRLYVRFSQHKKSHLGDKPYRCVECGKGFRLAKYLRQHESIHMGQRPFCCPDCGKSFRLTSHLRSHQLIHTEDKPFHCWDCRANFRLLGELQRHQQELTGVTPYQCPECGGHFRQQSSLIRESTGQRNSTTTWSHSDHRPAGLPSLLLGRRCYTVS